MLCFLTVRQLKPGSYDAFRQAWEPPDEWRQSEWAQRFSRIYQVRNLEDENEVISLGLFDGSRQDLERLSQEPVWREAREKQLAEIAEHVESVGADGIYEVVEEITP